MTDYCKSVAQVHAEVYIYDAYGDPITTITGSYPDGHGGPNNIGITDTWAYGSFPDDGQCPVIMVAELTGNADPPSDVLVLDPLMAVRLALRLMSHAALLLGADQVAAIRDETYKLTDAIAADTINEGNNQ